MDTAEMRRAPRRCGLPEISARFSCGRSEPFTWASGIKSPDLLR